MLESFKELVFGYARACRDLWPSLHGVRIYKSLKSPSCRVKERSGACSGYGNLGMP